jgi:hypothetical protein
MYVFFPPSSALLIDIPSYLSLHFIYLSYVYSPPITPLSRARKKWTRRREADM